MKIRRSCLRNLASSQLGITALDFVMQGLFIQLHLVSRDLGCMSKTDDRSLTTSQNSACFHRR